MIIDCQKCKKQFDTKLIDVIYKKAKRIVKCPFCNSKYEIFNNAKDLQKMPNGQLVRKNVKPKMKKKQRLKLRKELV